MNALPRAPDGRYIITIPRSSYTDEPDLPELPDIRNQLRAMQIDALTLGTGWMKDGKRIDPREIWKAPERKCICCGLPESQVRHD